MNSVETVRFYWSLRSPYSWLAVHRIPVLLAPLPVTVEWIPLYPRSATPFPVNPAKLSYVLEDVARFAADLGLELRTPPTVEADWPKAHAAFLYASDRGRGEAWAREALDARWTRGRDLGDDDVLAEIASRVGLEPDAAREAASDPELRARLERGFASAAGDAVFGVPTFVLRGERFWGNDRLEWMVRALRDLRP